MGVSGSQNSLLNFIGPVGAGKSAGLRRVSPVVKFVLGDDEDLILEYLASSSKVQNTPQTTIINIKSDGREFSDKIIPTATSKTFITEFTTPPLIQTETELTNKFSPSEGNSVNDNEEEEVDYDEETVNSDLIVVRGPLVPKDDPDIIHLNTLPFLAFISLVIVK